MGWSSWDREEGREEKQKPVLVPREAEGTILSVRPWRRYAHRAHSLCLSGDLLEEGVWKG